MRVFASCSSYVLGSLMGPARACELITQAARNATARPPCFAVRALRDLTSIADVTLRVDGGSSHLAKSRSRHFYDALMSDCEVWLSIDDDVSASRETLEWLLDAVTGDVPRVCLAPCLLRGARGDASPVLNVQWNNVLLERDLPRGGIARRCAAGGFGLVAMNRAAMHSASKACPTWRDPTDGNVKPAAFLEMLTDSGEWIGEDVAFFRRLPRDVEVYALVTGETLHAGHALSLEALHS